MVLPKGKVFQQEEERAGRICRPLYPASVCVQCDPDVHFTPAATEVLQCFSNIHTPLSDHMSAFQSVKISIDTIFTNACPQQRDIFNKEKLCWKALAAGNIFTEREIMSQTVQLLSSPLIR